MNTKPCSWILYRPHLFTILATAAVSAPLLISWSRYSQLLGTVPADLALGLSFCLSIIVALFFAGILSLAALLGTPTWTVAFISIVLTFGWFLGSNVNFLEYGAHWTRFDFTTLTSGLDLQAFIRPTRPVGGPWQPKAMAIGAVISLALCTVGRCVAAEMKTLHRPAIRFSAFFFLATSVLLAVSFWSLVNLLGASLGLRKALELGTSSVQPLQWLTEHTSDYIKDIEFPICTKSIEQCAGEDRNDRVALPKLDRVVLIVSDALRADHLAQYGYTRDTLPSLSRDASEVVVVPNYWSNGPHTLSALSTLIGSRYFGLEDPHILEYTHAFWRHLKQNQIHTGFFSSVDTHWGLFEERMGIVSDGETLIDERTTPSVRTRNFAGSLPLPTSFVRLPEKFAVDRLMDFYNRNPTNRSFSLLYTQATYFPWILSSVQPHFLPTIPGGLNVKDLESIPLEQTLNAYDNALFELDALVKGVSDVHHASPAIPSVIVIIGDHGESLGEQRTFFHGSSMREEQIRVPLIFLFNSKELAAAFRAQLELPTRAASHVDMSPTLLGLLAVPPLPGSQGVSLLSRCVKTEELLSYSASADFLCSLDMKTRVKRVLNINSHEMSTSNLLSPVHEGPFTLSSNQKLRDMIPPLGCLPEIDSAPLARSRITEKNG